MQLTKYLTKQKMMRTVLWSLVPIFLFSVYLFGWRVLILLLFNLIAAFAGELIILRMINGDKAKVSEAAFVTAALFTLTLPPTLPVWMSVVGVLFGIIFGKAIFGGFAKNIFNPALVGRAFIYVTFPFHMTTMWQEPFTGFPGGFLKYGADAVSNATPMIHLKDSGIGTNLLNLFLGNVGGSIGETSALLIILAAIYLIYTKTASWQIMAATVASGFAFSLFFQALNLGVMQDPLFAILSGGFLFGAVFMATDPVSAPKNNLTKWIFGILIGFCAVVIRRFSLFTEGMMFAILIANSFGPLLEKIVKGAQDSRKAKAKEA